MAADDDGLTGIWFDRNVWPPAVDGTWQEAGEDPVLASAGRQLDEYFAGTRQRFDLPLAPVGTPFQGEVWAALADLAFGTTSTYGELAAALGRPAAARAVGAANGRNPWSIVVPCHRLVAAGGNLIRYGGGLDRKRWLLDHESARRA